MYYVRLKKTRSTKFVPDYFTLHNDANIKTTLEQNNELLLLLLLNTFKTHLKSARRRIAGTEWIAQYINSAKQQNSYTETKHEQSYKMI